MRFILAAEKVAVQHEPSLFTSCIVSDGSCVNIFRPGAAGGKGTLVPPALRVNEPRPSVPPPIWNLVIPPRVLFLSEYLKPFEYNDQQSTPLQRAPPNMSSSIVSDEVPSTLS